MDIQDIREKFAQDASSYTARKSSDHNAFGGFVKANGTYVKVGRWACHGWLNCMYFDRWGITSASPAKYVLSAVMHRHDNVSKKQQLDFIDWHVNRSPWAHVFVAKDADDIMKYGYVADADNCPSFLANAFISSRFMTESYSGDDFCKRADIYHELLDAGCNNSEAFIFAHMYTHVKKDLYPITYSRLQSGHSTFYGSMYQENYVRNFLRGTPVNLTSRKMSVGQGYEDGTVNKVWGDQGKSDAFNDVVVGLIPESRQKKDDLHIFRKAPKQGFEYTNRADFLSIIDQLRRIVNA